MKYSLIKYNLSSFAHFYSQLDIFSINYFRDKHVFSYILCFIFQIKLYDASHTHITLYINFDSLLIIIQRFYITDNIPIQRIK